MPSKPGGKKLNPTGRIPTKPEEITPTGKIPKVTFLFL